jgi:hypothetical protein
MKSKGKTKADWGELKTYLIHLTVDNNRYGCYYKVFCSRIMKILAADEKDAYYIAAGELKKQTRYKNAEIRHFENVGHHDISSWSINFKAWAYAPKGEL